MRRPRLKHKKSKNMPLPISTRGGTGKDLFIGGIDGRTVHAKRFAELYYAMADDLGGVDRLSERQKQLIRRDATLSVLAETEEAALIGQTDGWNLEDYLNIIKTQARLGSILGIAKTRTEMKGVNELFDSTGRHVADLGEEEDELSG